jgi:hypothetical protein
MKYEGRVQLGDDDGPIFEVSIDNPDHARWEGMPRSADVVPGVTKGTPVLVRLLDGERAGQSAQGELEMTLPTSTVVLIGLGPFTA